MDDEAYVMALTAILTSRIPEVATSEDRHARRDGGIDGRPDDGIDREGGFGRDIWVESVVPIEAGDGPEIEVGFGLAVPADPEFRTVPRHGVVRVPFERRWRELSGYEDPVAYAPQVAREVEVAAHRQVADHRHGQTPSRRRDTARAALPDRQRQWRRLLDALNAEGWAVEIAPGRIDLRDDGDDGRPVVTVIVTPDQWEEVLVGGAAGNDVDLYIAELLGPRQADEHFVAFYKGELERSTREQPPPVRGRADGRRVRELPSRHPDGPTYEWTAR